MDPREILARCPLFSALDDTALDRLAAHCALISMAGGETLFAPGEVAEAMYIVVTGRLAALLPGDPVPQQISRLQVVGVIGLNTAEKRDARVHALRDTLLLRIGREDMLQFVEAYPQAMLTIAQEIITRLRTINRQRQISHLHRQHRVYAVVPANPQVDCEAFSRALELSLAEFGATRSIDSASVDAELGAGTAQTGNAHGDDNGRLVAWLNALESDVGEGHLIYTASRNSDTWSRRCMRQVDRILVVAHAGDLPMLTPMLDDVLRLAGETPIDLVLLRKPGQTIGDITAWRQRLRTPAHYFVNPGSTAAFDALARQLCGRGLGLVLGGGGARGFAHLGLLRALEAMEIPVDLAGGSSMGAFLAALTACGMDHREIREVTRATFVDHNYLNDYLLPRVSLIRGRKLMQRLRSVFGGRRIESLDKPFFCVSTNLTRGIASVHDTGELAMWVGTSMAIPGIAPPVAWRGELFVDGAVVNSLPTDIMQSLGRGPIIASDVSTEGAIAAPGIEGPEPEALLRRRDVESRVSLIDILFRTATLTSESGVKARAERADCYLRMPVTGIGLFDWKRLDEIADTSYAHAMRELEPMRDVLLGLADAAPRAAASSGAM